MKTKQSGFAVIESILVLVVIALVAFVGIYVIHTKHSVNNTLGSQPAATGTVTFAACCVSSFF